MRATAILALLSVTILSAAGCTSFTIQARGGSDRSVPEPPPRQNHDHDHDYDDDHGKKSVAKGPSHIPPGHFPPPGKCRVWHPGTPPGHQPPSGSCSLLEQKIGPGDWLIYRPSHDKQVVQVSFYDEHKPRVRVAVRFYDGKTGVFLREM